ncbi:MAG: hypothetical protein K2V38_06510 [Gemmataceae bacterium]|nr:hypothetical protein [Gemmataceae bacterium]
MGLGALAALGAAVAIRDAAGTLCAAFWLAVSAAGVYAAYVRLMAEPDRGGPPPDSFTQNEHDEIPPPGPRL